MKKYRLRRIGVASNAAATRPTLSDCIEIVLAQADPLAGDVLDALKAQFAKADPGKPRRDPVDPELQAEVLRLAGDAEALRSMFAAELRRLVYHSGAQEQSQSPLGRVEDIRVFDVFEIEAHIEQSLARQEVSRAVEDTMPLFDALVSALLGWGSVQPALNPLKPEYFVRALRETLDAWITDEALRTRVLRPAAVSLGIGLRQLFREACDWMVSQGVDPVVTLENKSRGGASAPVRQAQSELERTMAALDKLRRLLVDEALPPAVQSGGLRDFIQTVPASFVALQDLKLVEPMMKRLAERAPPGGGRFVGPLLVQTAEGPWLAAHAEQSPLHHRQMGRQLGKEVVRFMLDQLVQDERLLAPVRTQMRALESVLVQLASDDPRFFIDRSHPARQLLDRVAQLSLPYGRDDKEGVAGFVACVANAVKLLSDGPADAAAFASALVLLEEDCNAFEVMRRRLQQVVQNARLRAEQRMALAQRISDAMMERFRGAGLPELVAGFLRGPWAQVLAEAHLRGEEGSADPRIYQFVVEDLVSSVQFPQNRRDYARLVRLIPRLLARLNEGLVLIRYPQEPISLFLDKLSALHEKVLEDHRRALAIARETGLSQPVALADLPPEEDDGDAEEASPVAEHRVRQRPAPRAADMPLTPRDLMLGDWVDLLLEGLWVRARLSWISQNRNLFMFVSGAGLAHAMSRRSMDRLEMQNRLRVAGAAIAVDLVLEDAQTPIASGSSANAVA